MYYSAYTIYTGISDYFTFFYDFYYILHDLCCFLITPFSAIFVCSIIIEFLCETDIFFYLSVSIWLISVIILFYITVLNPNFRKDYPILFRIILFIFTVLLLVTSTYILYKFIAFFYNYIKRKANDSPNMSGHSNLNQTNGSNSGGNGDDPNNNPNPNGNEPKNSTINGTKAAKKKWRDNRSEERVKQDKERDKIAAKKRLESRTEEQILADKEKQKIAAKRRYHSRTPEQKAIDKEKRKIRYENRSEEQKAKNRESGLKYYYKHPSSQRSEEQKAIANAKSRDKYLYKTYLNLDEEE